MRKPLFLMFCSIELAAIGQNDLFNFTLYMENYTSEYPASIRNIQEGDSLFRTIVFIGDSGATSVFHFMKEDGSVNLTSVLKNMDSVKKKETFTKVVSEDNKRILLFTNDYGLMKYTCVPIDENHLKVLYESYPNGPSMIPYKAERIYRRFVY